MSDTLLRRVGGQAAAARAAAAHSPAGCPPTLAFPALRLPALPRRDCVSDTLLRRVGGTATLRGLLQLEPQVRAAVWGSGDWCSAAGAVTTGGSAGTQD